MLVLREVEDEVPVQDEAFIKLYLPSLLKVQLTARVLRPCVG